MHSKQNTLSPHDWLVFQLVVLEHIMSIPPHPMLSTCSFLLEEFTQEILKKLSKQLKKQVLKDKLLESLLYQSLYEMKNEGVIAQSPIISSYMGGDYAYLFNKHKAHIYKLSLNVELHKFEPEKFPWSLKFTSPNQRTYKFASYGEICFQNETSARNNIFRLLFDQCGNWVKLVDLCKSHSSFIDKDGSLNKIKCQSVINQIKKEKLQKIAKKISIASTNDYYKQSAYRLVYFK